MTYPSINDDGAAAFGADAQSAGPDDALHLEHSGTFTTSYALLNECFEAPGGFDDVYTWYTIDSGNNFYPDVATGMGSWGAESGFVEIGSGSGAAAYFRMLPAQTDTLHVHAETLLLRNGLADGESITIMVARSPAVIDGSAVAWALYYRRHGADTFFMLALGNFREFFRYPRSGSLRLRVGYGHDLTYDVAAGGTHPFSWRVNGSVVAKGTIPQDYPAAIRGLAIGSSSSSTGRNTSYLLDNILAYEPR